MVSAHTDIITWLDLRPTLPDEYGSGVNLLAAVSFYTEPF
jgi:hypothetical protein